MRRNKRTYVRYFGAIHGFFSVIQKALKLEKFISKNKTIQAILPNNQCGHNNNNTINNLNTRPNPFL